GAATSPGGGGGGGAATTTGGAGAGRAGMSGGERGGREGMRGEERGGREGMRGDRRGGADVNVRIGGRGGDREFIHGRRFHRGVGVVGVGVGGCRMIVKRVFFRHHMVVRRIKRCF
ncbi:MAG: hypothetical protein QOF41_2700, partial [Methylobacteriaceae bacterium]|nr:hypothetical protein [Methylobacteriaceae bacterium]